MTDELIIKYTFQFDNGLKKSFEIWLDRKSLNLKNDLEANYPDWAKLKNFKCPHCPLKDEGNDYCSIAKNISKHLEEFNSMPSFQNSKITVETESRTYFKNTSLQSGVSSMLGVIMVSSGCPIMEKLKPLLHFHLPFATLEDTQIKVLALYLLSQYISWKKGKQPDWELRNLIKIYEEIKILNLNVSKKIANLEAMDTNINSIVILNNFAEYVALTIDDKLFDEIEFYLKEFIEPNN
jgi:hypothetical protein